MKFHPIPIFVALACLALTGCAAQYKNKQEMLKASRFRTFAATTPSQVALLKTLPSDRISPVSNHRHTYYVFPDPEMDRIYAGTPQEYRTYQKLRARRKLPADKLDAAAMTGAPDWNKWSGLSNGWYSF
jgi:hypothetical protein